MQRVKGSCNAVQMFSFVSLLKYYHQALFHQSCIISPPPPSSPEREKVYIYDELHGKTVDEDEWKQITVDDFPVYPSKVLKITIIMIIIIIFKICHDLV